MSAVVLVACGLGWWQLGGQGTANVIAPTAAAAAAAVGGEQNILVVGLDSRADAQGNPLPQQVLDQLHAGSSSDGGDNTDTMIIIHIPTGGGKATGFSIPRDSYVQLAEGYGAHKINSAYTYGQNAARTTLTTQGVSGPTLAVQSAAGGARTAIATVSALTGLAITHYAAVNLAGFYAISQAVGGVSVCLNTSVDDSYSGAHFPAGPQTVQGSEALAFVRQRHGLPGGDLDRIHRQQVFTASMARTVLSAGTLTDPPKLNALITAIGGSVVLDQGWDLLSFATQLQTTSSDVITFQTIPIASTALDTPDDGQAVQVDPTAVQAFIHTAINPPAAATPRPATRNYAAANTVDVLNASATSGLAAATMADLASAGFTPGVTGNAPLTPTTAVSYPPGGEAAADATRLALGHNGVSLVPNPNLPPGHLRVMLGLGYLPTNPTPSNAQPPASAPVTADNVPCIN